MADLEPSEFGEIGHDAVIAELARIGADLPPGIRERLTRLGHGRAIGSDATDWGCAAHDNGLGCCLDVLADAAAHALANPAVGPRIDPASTAGA